VKRILLIACGIAAASVAALRFLPEEHDMKMTAIEKYFVNSASHAASVARHAGELLERIELRPGAEILDIGCGTGAAARRIAATRDARVTGIDIDPKQIELARAAGAASNVKFEVADATRLPFAGSSFDAVTASMVMHHIPGWERAFAEMARVARPGGHIVLTDIVLPWGAGMFPSERKLEEAASKAGLERVYRTRSFARMDTIWRKR
jgi:ubiquinone/menaquinone biosynthesis C-methylase UbiE